MEVRVRKVTACVPLGNDPAKAASQLVARDARQYQGTVPYKATVIE